MAIIGELRCFQVIIMVSSCTKIIEKMLFLGLLIYFFIMRNATMIIVVIHGNSRVNSSKY